ncbi:MAG: endonuclease III [Dysgonamonadaceae bacterium]|nr:endonuclease III [Dysgonamonadaceae bacterium]
MNKKLKVMNIIEQLEIMYPYAECSLDYQDPIQLMVATQLAAQCTDARVNIVTKELFKKYKSVDDYANANLQELEQDIRSTGFYHNKARNIIAACRMIIDVFDRNVPSDMDSLLMLPGVGRKTANLILNDWFGVPGVVVDTHAKRLVNRMGLTKNSDPEKIEYDLMRIIPKEKWGRFCHQLVFHGRAICTARKPLCEKCGIMPFCKFGSANT